MSNLIDQAGEGFHDEENLYRILAESSQDVIFLIDRKGYVRYLNSYAAQFFGAPQEEIRGRHLKELFPPAAYELQSSALQQVFKSGEPSYLEENLSFSARKIWLETRLMPIRQNDGSVGYVMGVSRDVTERKLAEEELKRYRDNLEDLVSQRTKELSTLNDQLIQSQKMEAVGLLAGGIAHDFTNILTTIKGSMYLIQKQLQKNSPLEKYIEQVITSVTKATNFSHSLLAFSKKQMINLRPIYVNEIIRRVAKLLSQLIGEHIELVVTLHDKNPMVMADANQMEQVLVNLATNARDAMPDGGTFTIQVDVIVMDEKFRKEYGYGLPGRYALIAVSDTGTGIDEKIREKIFEPFFTTKVLGKGSGLGLAVTYGIVKQHNGFIDMESAPGKGTTFKIYIPIMESEVVLSKNRDVTPVIGGTETILLAEDDADARAIMSEMLSMTGYNVLEAGDGNDAIEVFMENKDRIHLVLLDVRMPKRNGREAYREIKRVNPKIKALFISGYTADVMDGHGISEEEFNFISKTASPDEILGKIRELLDK